MNHSILAVAMAALLTFAPCAALAQDHAPSAAQSTEAAAPGDPAAKTTAKPADAAATQTDLAADKAPTTQADDATGSQAQQDDALADAGDANEATMVEMEKQGQSGEGSGFHQVLKTKFIEGNAGFMSLVSLALILGLAFCIERIIFLSLSEINAKKFMADIASRIAQGDTTWKVIPYWAIDGLEPTHGTVQYGEMQHIIVHVLENGTGTDRAAFTDSVKVHYEGHLIPSPTYTAGYRFDASYSGTFSPVTSNPTILKISNLTDGFATAVMKMRAGDHSPPTPT